MAARPRPYSLLRAAVLLALLAAFWLSGAVYAPRVVAGLARLDGGARGLLALSMGGFGWLWGGLKRVGVVVESAESPHLLWIPLALALPTAVYGVILLLDQEPHPAARLARLTAALDQTQGRVAAAELAATHAVTAGVPFVQVTDPRGKPVTVGLDYAGGEGHILVTAPTRAGKGLHLTESLLAWPGPVLVVDPKGEQLARTAATRARLGPVYRLPGHALPLAGYYDNLDDRDAVAELHAHLLRPWESRETIFAEKALSLFVAAGLYARARGLDPLRVLLDLAESDPADGLAGLEQEPAARRHVRVFTNGAGPTGYRDDKFVTSAYGNFTTRLATYQKHIDTIAPPPDQPVIPADWPARGGTVYITYSLQELRGVGGVVAAVVAAVLRAQMAQPAPLPQRDRLLVAVDELPAIGLRNVADYLATCGGYGITLLLYVQSVAQLHGLYGRDGTRAILANCAHQLWYPPAEPETAALMSALLGVTLTATPAQSGLSGTRQQTDRDGWAHRQAYRQSGVSWSWQERPLLRPSQMLALARDEVLVTTAAARRRVFIGQRLNPVARFNRLPSADGLGLPAPRYGERVYLGWGAAAPDAAETVTATDSAESVLPDAAATGTAPDSAESDPPPRPKTSRKPNGGSAGVLF